MGRRLRRCKLCIAQTVLDDEALAITGGSKDLPRQYPSESPQDRSRVEAVAHARAVPRDPAARHRARFQRPLLEPEGKRHVWLRLLWRTVVLLQYQIRLGHRLAKFLGACRQDRGERVR